MEKRRSRHTTSADAISDDEIIARVLKGEKDMYALIVSRYNQRLFRVGMSITKDAIEVEDVMQVVYIKAYENLAKFEFKSSFSTWITRILINESLLRVRKRKQSVTMVDDILNSKSYQQQTAEAETPLKHVLNSELKGVLEEAILQLPEKYRTVFIMREIENMTVAETKECLNLSEANVKVRLNRAKALLQNLLSNYYKKEEMLHLHLSKCNQIRENVMSQIERR
jgi:RNA polymerase sigma-70 factor (ECF subfamily)